MFFFIIIQVVGADDDIYEAIDEAINEVTTNGEYSKFSSLIDSGYEISRDDGVLDQYVLDGDEEKVLFLLKNGANANGLFNPYTHKDAFRHLLEDADSENIIFALLSYGANPDDCGFWEFSRALYDERWLHLIIYYFWGRSSVKVPRPVTVTELHTLVFQFPMLTIRAMLSLLNKWSTSPETKPDELPKILKEFYQFLE